MPNIIRFGIDLAKPSFAVCGVDENGHIIPGKAFDCRQLLGFFAHTPLGSATHRASSIQELVADVGNRERRRGRLERQIEELPLDWPDCLLSQTLHVRAA